jgi:uncharacterized protein
MNLVMPQGTGEEIVGAQLPKVSTYIVKITGACNLNCSYCYMYNMGDTTYKGRPRIMSKETAEMSLDRIFSYSVRSGRKKILIAPHGGEPLLAGKQWMRWFLDTVREKTPACMEVNIAVQTNGTLFDEEWLDLFAAYDVHVGISIDGPEEWHDRFRVNFAGHGSYKQVKRAIDLLVSRGHENPPWGVLVVANCEYSGAAIFNHLVEIGVRKLDFLWPDYHHDNPPPWKPGALARYYIEIFDEWYSRRDPSIRVRWFNSVLRLIFGFGSCLDSIGPAPLEEVSIESDGGLEPLDALRTIGDGFCQVGLNVHTHEVDDLMFSDIGQASINNQSLLPSQCHQCPAYTVCGGGWMPHRWGRGRQFANPSVHCEDLFQVFSHMASRVRAELEQTSAS